MHLVKYCMTRQHGMNYSIVFSAILSVSLCQPPALTDPVKIKLI